MLIVPGSGRDSAAAGGVALVLVVHRSRLFLAALDRILAGPPLRAQVVAFTRSDEAMSHATEHAVDLVLCELRSEPVPGDELARRLAEGGGPPVGLIADPEDADLVLDAARVGAGGVFTVDVSQQEFTEGVDAILRGHFVMSSALARRGLERIAARETAEPGRAALRQLSVAEREILILLGRAISIETIASTRGITKKTVRNHVASIYRKLELRSRADAIVWVARMGLHEGKEAGLGVGDRASA